MQVDKKMGSKRIPSVKTLVKIDGVVTSDHIRRALGVASLSFLDHGEEYFLVSSQFPNVWNSAGTRQPTDFALYWVNTGRIVPGNRYIAEPRMCIVLSGNESRGQMQ